MNISVELAGTLTGQRLRSRILVPLLVTLTILAGAFVLVFDWNLKRDYHQRAADKTSLADWLLQARLNKTSDALTGLLQLMQGDPILRSALRTRNREQLLAHAGEMFSALRDSHWISHWYFSGPDRNNILRVHSPQHFGDRIDRFTTAEADTTGRPARGLECA